MTRRSLMIGGGRMNCRFDDLKGHAEGSVIRMGGSAFGIHLSVEEIVTDRVAPLRKRWRTVGTPQMHARWTSGSPMRRDGEAACGRL